MMRYWQKAVAFISATLTIPAFAWECGAPPDQWANKASIVFEGKVISISPLHDKESREITGRRITFKVIKTISGIPKSEVVIDTGLFGVSPAFPFLCGENYLVYVKETEHGNITNACYPNQPIGKTPNYDELEVILYGRNRDQSKVEYYVNRLSSCNENN